MRILQIAYYYPPMGGAGVQRALKFSRYLPDFGVDPVVLAAADPGYVADASLAAEIPVALEVHRVAHSPLLQRLMRWRAGRVAASTAGSRAAAAARTASTSTPASTVPTATAAARPVAIAPKSPGLPTAVPPAARRLRDVVLRLYAALQFPDDKAAWARRAWPVARRILRAQPVDLIFSSSPPASAHALGARLARASGLPWVADYRDLWTEISSHGAPAWRQALDRRVEAGWLRHAAGVVTVTPSWQRLLADRLGRTCPVAFIPNGYDERDFAALPERPRRPDEFMLVHTGTFYGPRDPGALLAGVGRYLGDGKAMSSRRLRVRLIGNIGARFDALLAAFDADHPGVVERVPYRPHREALAELMAADALLLVVGGWQGAGGAGLLPGKIFEYLRAAKPVLLLGAADGDAAELVRRHARGVIVDGTDPDRIAAALRTLVDGPALPAPAAADVARFERRELARQLAEFLTRCRDDAARRGAAAR